MLRVAIVDDHPIARYGLRAILADAPGLAVVAAVGDCADLAREAGGSVAADVVILDLYLSPGRPAVEAVEETARKVPVLVVSASRAPVDVLAAMRAGASGYLTKHADRDAYIAAIQAVAAGQFHLSSQLADMLQVASERSPADAGERLSPREQEALGYIARGFTHQQAARRMGVSKPTVDTYVARIRSKLGLGNKAELALAALRYLNVDAVERLT
jgi:two-component system, NarL family, nitrate/nitrite response regulator NarL